MLNPYSAATRMLFTGMGGPRFRSQLTLAAIAAETLPDLCGSGGHNTPVQGHKGYREPGSDDHNAASDEEFTAIHMENPLPAPVRQGSPHQRISDLQTLTDQALAETDHIVSAQLDETVMLSQAVLRRIGNEQHGPKKACSLPVCMHSDVS